MQQCLGAFGGEDEEETNEDGELVSVVEARKEAEEKRREKHRQMEAEREDIRQSVRDKVGQVYRLAIIKVITVYHLWKAIENINLITIKV